MKALKLILAGLIVTGATFLVAETLPTRGPLPFSTYDKDNNNVITVKEFNVIKKQRIEQKYQEGRLMRNAVDFSDIDTNSDGIITKEELKIHQDKRFMNRMNQRNLNKQGGRGMGMGQGQGPNW